jgi:hypothetical protein
MVNKNKYLKVFCIRRRLVVAGAVWPVHAWVRALRAQSTRFELVANMKVAKVLGITIPQSFLSQVDRVVE